jgi:hypothetical protein
LNGAAGAHTLRREECVPTNEHAASSVYPLRVEGELDGHLNRWLWLVKWVL